MKLAVLFLLLFSCSRSALQTTWDRDHVDYLSSIERQRRTLSREDYTRFIEREAAHKQQELNFLKGYRKEGRSRLNYHESGVDRRDPLGTTAFKVQSGRMEQRQTAQKIAILEKELFFLRGEQNRLQSR